MTRALTLGLATTLYVVVAWSVRPGFYDGPVAPNYAYVSPPPIVAPGNVAPTSGSGTLGPAGGSVATRDQPTPQAEMDVPPNGVPVQTQIHITPYAPSRSGAVTLTGNVYCVTATSPLATGAVATVKLLYPVFQAPPDAMYFADASDSPAWSPLGGSLDQSTYLMSARTTAFGCFATGYRTPKPSSGPTIGGALLPVVVAVLITAVLLAGLPLALPRRRA